jgi:glycosyltransferase 2 family protein
MRENSLTLSPHRELRVAADESEIPTRRKSLPVGFLLRLAVSGGLAWFLLSKSDLGAIRGSLAHLDGRFWVAALAVYLVSQVVSGHRWSTLGRAVGFGFPWTHFQKLYFEGMFFSLCLPSSIGGDVVKAMRLGRTASERFLAAGTVLADRLTGLTALGVICATGFLSRAWQLSLMTATFLGAGVLLVALTTFTFGQWLLRSNSSRLERIPKLGTLLVELNIYNHRPGVVFRAVGWSFAVQLTNILMVWLLGRGIGLELPTASYFVAVPAVALASTLPLSINGVGVREGGLALLLRDDGLTEEQGVALGLLWFSITMASGLIGGLAFLWDGKKRHQESIERAE